MAEKRQQTSMAAENIEQAIVHAIDFFQRLYEGDHLRDILLEEVREKNEQTWEVTIGFSRAKQEGTVSPLVAVTGPTYERAYKVLAVDKATGKVKSMVIRNVGA